MGRGAQMGRRGASGAQAQLDGAQVGRRGANGARGASGARGANGAHEINDDTLTSFENSEASQRSPIAEFNAEFGSPEVKSTSSRVLRSANKNKQGPY